QGAGLVVLDEPTAHLDAHSAARIRGVLRGLATGTLPDGSKLPIILLVSSHDELIHQDAAQLVGNTVVTAKVEVEHNETPAVASASTSVEADATPQRSVRLADWLRFLPFNEGKFIGGIASAVAAPLA